MSKIIKATHTGILEIGDKKIACAVLEDGTRVLTQTSMIKALGRKGNSLNRTNNNPLLPAFLDYSSLKPFIPRNLTSSLSSEDREDFNQKYDKIIGEIN